LVNGPFTIAVASGKGGTGKTTVSVALARSATRPATILDCDVEEPNAALFLFPKTEPDSDEEASVLVPSVDTALCDACGECSRFCRFSAIAVLGKAMPFPELCHGCGGCAVVCPKRAITEIPSPIGRVRSWRDGSLRLVDGELKVGSTLAPALIRDVTRRAARGEAAEAGIVIVDSPPGTSCAMAAAVKDADALLLVTEPTPFGLNDLKLAVECARSLALPLAVLMNRDGSGTDATDAYCESEGIPVIGRIRDDKRIAEAYARGRGLIEAAPEYRALMAEVLRSLEAIAGRTA